MLSMSAANAVRAVAAVHLLLMIGELYRWETPFIMDAVLKKWPEPLDLSPADRRFAAAVVHNAAIYNGIVGAGLLAAAAVGSAALPVQLTLLAGGVVAGVFGARTLSPVTIAQAIVGALAIGWVLYKG